MINQEGVTYPRTRIAIIRGVLLSGARDYASVMVGVGLTRLLTFVAAVLLARSMSIASFGAYSFAYTVMTLVSQLPRCLTPHSFETMQSTRIRRHGGRY